MSTRRLQILSPEKHANPGPEWLGGVLDDFRANLLDPEYPCNFGRNALRHGDMYTSWIDHDATGARPSTLPEDVADFLDRTKLAPQRRSPLALFVEPGPQPPTEGRLDAKFWSILQYLHDNDDRPWPADLPENPDESGWEFCYHGSSLFVFALVPTNTDRMSRGLCSCLALMFQPRAVFRGIEVGSPPGDMARRGIRKRLARWDSVGPHPSMGHYGEISDDEWRQYFIGDGYADLHERCPFISRHQPPIDHSTPYER